MFYLIQRSTEQQINCFAVRQYGVRRLNETMQSQVPCIHKGYQVIYLQSAMLRLRPVSATFVVDKEALAH